MRRIAVIGAALALTVSAGTVAIAGRYYSDDQKVDRQSALWTAGRPTHATRNWSPIPWDGPNGGSPAVGFGQFNITANGTITVTVSLTLKGGPVAIRVRDGRHHMHPGAVRFAPTAGGQSVSYTFVNPGGHPVCGRNLDVQWRRVSAARVTLTGGDAIVTYQHDTTAHGQVGCA